MRFNRSFSIYQQYDDAVVSIAKCILKGAIGLVPGTAANQLPTRRLVSGGLLERIKKRVHSLSKDRSAVALVPAAFHVNRHAAHGFAPSSPMRHRSPSRYSSNHEASLAGSRRRSSVPAPGRSHAMMASGWLVSARYQRRQSGSLPTSCMRSEASTSRSASRATASGCRPSSGSSTHTTRGGSGVRRVASSAMKRIVPSDNLVAGMGAGEIGFVQKELHCTA